MHKYECSKDAIDLTSPLSIETPTLDHTSCKGREGKLHGSSTGIILHVLNWTVLLHKRSHYPQDGDSALILAAWMGKNHSISLLVRAGATLDLQNKVPAV